MNRDPLLACAHVLVALCIALFIFLAAMMLIGLGALLTVGRAEIMGELATEGVPATAYLGVAAIMALLFGLFLVVVRFLLELRGIVLSVDRGDPFEPENAGRLWRMGWLTVAGYAISMVIGSIGVWIKAIAGEAGKDIQIDAGLDGGGVLLILVLFILARVFRQGAAMREDLEGTV